MDKGIDQVENGHQNNCAGHVKIQINEGGPSTVYIGADGREQYRCASADTHADDHGNGHIVTNDTCSRQSLQNTDRSRSTLNNSRDHCAHQQSQDGMGNSGHKLNENRAGTQGLHGSAHRLHAGHQHGKCQQDHTDILQRLLFAEEVQEDTHKGNECKNRGRGHIHTGQNQYPAGGGSTDICTHNNANGIGQLHDAGVYKTHHHDRRGRRGLDRSRNYCAQKNTLQRCRSQFAKDRFQFAAGNSF